MQLKGYVRRDNRVGFRNLVAIIPLTGCVQGIAFRIAAEVNEAVALWQPLGCELLMQDQQQLGKLIYRLATHPNVGAVIFLTMGCAAANVHLLPASVKKSRPVRCLNIQSLGGTTIAVKAGVNAATELAEQLKAQQRREVPLSSIVLGTKCGASDKTSFDVCHPVVGAACDRLIDLGGTVVLSEDCELAPAVEDLAARALDDETAKRIRTMASNLKTNWKKRYGQDLVWDDFEQARYRSLAHAAKAGTKPIRAVYSLGDTIEAKGGLVVLDAPNSDLISVASMMAAGCNLLLFTTGRGTPVTAPLVPTVKVTSNPKSYRKMKDNTDMFVGVGDLQDPDRILEDIVEYANGKHTRGEILGHGEMFIPITGVTF